MRWGGDHMRWGGGGGDMRGGGGEYEVGVIGRDGRNIQVGGEGEWEIYKEERREWGSNELEWDEWDEWDEWEGCWDGRWLRQTSLLPSTALNCHQLHSTAINCTPNTAFSIQSRTHTAVDSKLPLPLH